MLPSIGLSERSAQDRLERDGSNELPTAKPRRILVLLKEVIAEPMVSLLIACGCDLSRTG
jgi:Ca2+-transporting ATPase